MTQPVIEAAGITKAYAGEQALKGVDLRIEPGSLYGIIGADGAGKTTLLEILATLLAADRGSARILDKCVNGERNAIRTRIGYMPERFSLYLDLTVMENLTFFADIFGVRGTQRTRRVERLLQFARLENCTARRAAALSGGMKQKLALACALIHEPPLLLLDEPTIGVDPLSRREFWHLLGELCAQGTTVVVSTPYMDETGYCSRLSFLHEGRVIREGTPSDFVGSYPLSLFRLCGTVDPAAGPLSQVLEPGILLCYHAGGEVRLAARTKEEQASLSGTVEKVFGPAARIEPLAATMEDVFIQLLHEHTARAADHGGT